MDELAKARAESKRDPIAFDKMGDEPLWRQ
jgi:hypothetical protein